ncbi:HET-domain-containing protein [Parathielavia appendiculata]|uniref:HET-domain-containing protein n=1 Tax=Parathielavia appendiculata TaxID=2587402 RepID=A0AAN6YZV6_9PEZI|nr:HET-domain-containing protein [Parathielavia appendiculata]
MCLKWPVRLSSLIEAAQRGCAFCCFFLSTFFRESNFESHYYTETRPWYARPAEHDKERMELVKHCMSTLAKMTKDRFEFYLFPICSRKGVGFWDFDKLRFQLSNSSLESYSREDLQRWRVFHSAGVIATERYVFAAKGDPASQHISSRPPNPSPGSPEAIDQVKAWLHDCDLHHGAACRPPITGSSLPSRVIDVSDPTGTLRLHPTTTIPSSLPPNLHVKPLRYAALSYCWGGPQPFQTTLSTLSARQQGSGFPLTSLPPTLQDAVLLTQCLDIPYLWVDSLCIVQDSSEDKFRELARMSDIYKHAYLTITAARASSAGEGFLGDRADPETGLWRALVPVSYRMSNAHATSWAEAAEMPPPQEERGTLYLLEEPASMSQTVKDPVAERAWCLQERVLSPRVVSYGRWPMWRCSRVVGSDGGFVPSSVSSPEERRLTQALVQTGTRSVVADGDQIGRDMRGGGGGELNHFRTAELLETWRRMVEDYTKRKLAFSTDRMPAIAGIAREMARLTGMEYLAGLWNENMLQDLMWYAKTQEWMMRPPHTLEYPLAPTWSWAAVEAPILCDAVTGDATPLAKVLRCQVHEIQGKSTYDVIAGGELEIQGPFMELKKEDVVELLRKQNLAPAPPLSNDVQEWYRQMLDDMATRPDRDKRVSIDDVEAHLPERVFGLMLFERDWTSNRWDGSRPKVVETCYFGLLLQKVHGGRYERIGSFFNDTSAFLDQSVSPWGEETVVLI